MVKPKTSKVTGADSPAQVVDYQQDDNSNKNIISTHMEKKRGIALSSLDAKDLNRDRDRNRPSIREPESGKQEIEEPPQPKAKP